MNRVLKPPRKYRLFISTHKTVLRWIALAIIFSISLYHFSDLFLKVWTRLQAEPVRLTWHLIVAAFLFAIAVAVSGILWARTLASVGGPKIGLTQAIQVQIVSWLLRYVPGQVGALGYKLVWARRKGFAASFVASSLVYENVLLILASFIPWLGILFLFGHFGWGLQSEILITSAFAIVCLALTMFFGAVVQACRKLSPKLQRLTGEHLRMLRPIEIAQLTTLFTIPRAINAVGFVLIVKNLAEFGVTDAFVLGAAYVVAGAVGILAVFVPSGLGVREGAIVLLAMPILGAESALLAAILARVVTMIADVVLIFIAIASRIIRGGDAK